MFLRCTAAFAALLLAASTAYPEDNSHLENHLSEAVSVGYVMIPFTVLGSQGNPITDLREGEVKLEVDGNAVARDLFEKSHDAPVSFTILLDGSGSMALAGKMDSARAAVDALIAHRRPGDDFALYVFDQDEAHEVVPFTEDPRAIARALQTIEPFGKTAFFDALSTMPERSRLGRNATRAIILLSDGIDNASKLTKADLARQLQGIAIPIYPLGLREKGEQTDVARDAGSDLALLDDVASLTGGRLFVGNQPEQLGAAVESLEKNLRAQYLIGFTPTGRGAVKYRHISLRLAGRVHSVRVRAGYLGTEPPGLAAASSREKSKRSERKGS
ncbi:MAG TPA: VWA domain-containing protein [Thermoanaerobaculia bacterium]|nr:VWA domain-containing protein [Thermoanaerobaculia bacterium]